MAMRVRLETFALLLAKHVNEGCENSVKSIAETTSKPIDPRTREAKLLASSILAQQVS
jgi:hypothetical protein